MEENILFVLLVPFWFLFSMEFETFFGDSSFVWFYVSFLLSLDLCNLFFFHDFRIYVRILPIYSQQPFDFQSVLNSSYYWEISDFQILLL
jgi:hypothetical protein